MICGISSVVEPLVYTEVVGSSTMVPLEFSQPVGPVNMEMIKQIYRKFLINLRMSRKEREERIFFALPHWFCPMGASMWLKVGSTVQFCMKLLVQMDLVMTRFFSQKVWPSQVHK